MRDIVHCRRSASGPVDLAVLRREECADVKEQHFPRLSYRKEATMCAERSGRALLEVHCLPKIRRVRHWAIIPRNEEPEVEEWMVAGIPDAKSRWGDGRVVASI